MKTYATIAGMAVGRPHARSLESASVCQPGNPSRGQFGMTSLTVQDIYGGELLPPGHRGNAFP